MSVEVAAGDIAKILLQFCRENGLSRTMETLEEEAQVYLNTVENVDAVAEDIESGQWDAVIRSLHGRHLREEFVINLFEQVVLELVELRELDAARAVLRTSTGLDALKRKDPDRYGAIERTFSLAAVDSSTRGFDSGPSKQARRNALAKALREEVVSVAPSRLLVLFGQALKFQHSQGLVPPGTKFDLFRNLAPELNSEADAPCVSLTARIQFGKKQFAECAAFSPRDDLLVTGSSDGFIEVWDYLSGKYRKDLKYQAEEDLMSHDEKICSLAFSREGEILASGGLDKKLKVWRLRSGKVMRRFELVRAPSCVEFSRDGTQLLVGFPDGTIRILGLKSGKVLKEFHGHTACVNDVQFSSTAELVLSASSDGTIRVWSTRTLQSVQVLRPPHLTEGTSIQRLIPLPDDEEKYLVCCRSPILQHVTINGAFSGKIDAHKVVVDVCLSAKGTFIYALGEDGFVRTIETASKTSEVLKEVKAISSDSIALAHHPQKNVLVAFGTDGEVKVFRPA